jgi:hypothetical protein
MKKTILFLSVISLMSCQKEDITDNNDNNDVPINVVIPSTIELTYSELAYSTLSCTVDYTNTSGQFIQGSIQMDRKVENVDFSKPFTIRAQAGVTFYPVGQPPQPDPQTCTWVLKKDGYVIDTRVTSNYVYQN